MLARLAMIAVLVGGCDAPSTTTADQALACDLGSPDGLGNACVKSADPVPVNATATILANVQAYGVHLAPVAGGNGATLPFRVHDGLRNLYSIYLSAPNIPVTVRAADGSTVASECTTTITSTQCSTLRLVGTYNLRDDVQYQLVLGPVANSYVRVEIQAHLYDPQVCEASTLSAEAAACTAADQGSEPVTAGGLASRTPPVLVEDTVYTLALPSTGGSNYGGAFRFTASSDTVRELYLGTPNIPLRVVDEDSAVDFMSCSRYIPSSECDRLRRGDVLTMTAGHTYRFELGPAANTHYVRVTLREASGSQGSLGFGPPQTYAAGTTGYYVTAADLDSDGVVDLVESSPDDASGQNEVHILHGSGTGAFTDVNTIATSAPAETVVSDWTGDGIADIAGIAWDGQGPLPDFYLQGQGNFTYAKSTWGDARDFNGQLRSGDFDEDGTLDLVAPYRDDATQTGGFVILKMPGFTVSDDVPAFGHDISQAVAGDFDGDGHQDVIASPFQTTGASWYRGDGSGKVTFAGDITLPGGTIRALAAFDLDRDGRSDLIAIHNDGTATVSYGTATGLASAQVLQPVAASARGIAAGDFDNDGRLDLAIGNAEFSSGSVDVWRNTTTGFTHAVTLNVAAGVGWGLAAADFNGDGVPDLAVPGLDALTIYLATP